MTELECLTWNLHRCRGRDGRVDPARTGNCLVELLAAHPPDVVVLTEADAETPPYGAVLDMDRITVASGLGWAQTEERLRWGPESHGFLGTVVLMGPRIEVLSGHLLDLPGHYPRGAVFLTARVDGTRPVRIVATHLSLGQPLRIAQMRAIGQYLDRQEALPTVLIGDLNEWRPWGGLAFSARVSGRVLKGPARRSFPSARPLLPLDRVLAAAGARVLEAQVHRRPGLVEVSDHLPLRARVALEPG